MNWKKKLIIALGVALGVALVAGITALAVGNYGTESDPLVTLSYLNDTVTPTIMKDLDDYVDEKADELTDSFAELAENGGTESGFSVISLTSGQTLSCSVGTEIMLRIGTAVSYGEDVPRLIDESTTESVINSEYALTANHMYMVTIQGNGIKATSNVKILIRGSYVLN